MVMYKLYQNLVGGEKVEKYSTSEPHAMYSKLASIHDWGIVDYTVATIRTGGGVASTDSHWATEWLSLYQKWIDRGVC